jgi:hypothetical protein
MFIVTQAGWEEDWLAMKQKEVEKKCCNLSVKNHFHNSSTHNQHHQQQQKTKERVFFRKNSTLFPSAARLYDIVCCRRIQHFKETEDRNV